MAGWNTIPGISVSGGDAPPSRGMTSAVSSLSVSAFASADAGFEYLATAEHYRYLAKGIVDALRQHCLVLLTGDPPANPPMLAAALRAAASRAVIELCAGPDLDCGKLFGGGAMRPDTPAPAAIGEEPGHLAPPSAIFVVADADRLSDPQIEELCEAAQALPPEPHGFEAGVLLADSGFVNRATSVGLHLFDRGLAGHLRVQQLERDEIEAFIRHQLPSGESASLLNAQRVALIALTSGGDPAVVNRLARRMLEIEPDVSAPPPVTRRRSAVSLKLLAGIFICLGVVWFTAGTLEPQRLDVRVGLVRDRILPRNEHAAAPAGVAAVPSPEAAGSSSVNVANAPPTAAPAGRATPEPRATSASPSGLAPAPASTVEPAPPPGSGGPQLSAGDVAALIARGDAFLGAGDIASARLFFERAADSGDGRAAMRMAVTYDAAFLERAGLHGLGGDPQRAAFWYRRARELGEHKAAPSLGRPGMEPTAAPR
jgi:hypothetical protein